MGCGSHCNCNVGYHRSLHCYGNELHGKQCGFSRCGEGFPAFVAVLMMPFSYSIAEGVMWGIIAYVILNAVIGRARAITHTWGIWCRWGKVWRRS
ncbi:NCS2 family nucleobase:cation symporter-2 [Treponema pallidum subsp. pallidum DAL-1]|nr:NCS2 family nucleobase:cation symporter-2 [Treponema pallidum subsp. pallidum DAL-1]AGN75645.1 NCS2 family nucleobase:cation symporter-2 [Treponema pallidum subsp. pallidum str. Nichols]AGN76621.1 NCS2 family nucleobase:cation symporter-2 [Treponema pallidum subsp. pallidum SS14]ANI47240.1 permease [Treponema pallidum subsp. pallidum]QFP69339.1 permease [Treponema pallidum]